MKGSNNLLDYWIALYKRRYIIFFVIVSSIIASVVLSKILTPIYEARASFILPADSKAVSFLSTKGTEQVARSLEYPTHVSNILECYVSVMKTPDFAKRVSQYLPAKKPKDLVKNMSFDISKSVIEIYARDKDPETAAQMANTYMESFNNFLHEDSSENLTLNIALLDKQLTSIKERIEEAQINLKSFEEKNNIASLDDEIKNLTTMESSFKSKLEETNVQVESVRDKIRTIVQQLEKESGIYKAKQFTLTNPVITHLQEKLYDLSSKIAFSSIELKEKHPDILSLKEQYNDVERQLKAEIEKLITSQIKNSDSFYEKLRQDLVNNIIEEQRLKSQKIAYVDVILKIEKKIKDFPEIKVQWNNLNDRVERYKKMYEQMISNSEESKTQRNRKVQMVTVVNWAERPEDPAFPVAWLNITVAILVGLLFGIIYALFLDYIEKSRKIRLRKLIKAMVSKEE